MGPMVPYGHVAHNKGKYMYVRPDLKLDLKLSAYRLVITGKEKSQFVWQTQCPLK